jgi:hypothetical protein
MCLSLYIPVPLTCRASISGVAKFPTTFGIRALCRFPDPCPLRLQFQFEMSKARAEIRLREGRAKPIDILAKNLKLSDDFDMEIDEPYTVFQGLAVADMEELQGEIRMYQELDRAPELHADFWDAMMVIAEAEIAEAKRRDALELARVRGEEPPLEFAADDMGLHASVDADVKSMLTGKSHEELAKMEAQIEEKMAQGTAKVSRSGVMLAPAVQPQSRRCVVY